MWQNDKMSPFGEEDEQHKQVLDEFSQVNDDLQNMSIHFKL